MGVEKILKSNLDTFQQTSNLIKKSLLDAANCSDHRCQQNIGRNLISVATNVAGNIFEMIIDAVQDSLMLMLNMFFERN